MSKYSLAALLAGAAISPAMAGEKEELLKIRNTTLNLIELLVEQGVLDKSKAEAMIQKAEAKAAADAKKAVEEEKVQAARDAAPGDGGSKPAVRVTYVPDFVKDEIRQQVRDELRADVVKDVKAHAKEEKWGIPAALPDWVNRFKLTGDMRLRGEGDFFPSSNFSNEVIRSHESWLFANWYNVNNGASVTDIRPTSTAYLNTSEDVYRYRMRFRLGLEAQITDGLKANARLATSNSRSPVSTNQTLGQTGQQYEFVLDRAFLQYDYKDGKGRDWLTLWAGRTMNPWLSTDNVFDSDVSFEGVTGTFRVPLPGGSATYVPPTPNARYGTNMGFTRPNSVFLTSGVYPLEEFQLSSNDKWLWGSQLGVDLLFQETSRFKAGVAYYNYRNVKAQPNHYVAGVAGDLGDRNYTAPQFMQKGNTLMQINTSGDPSTTNFPSKVGLASGFEIFNAVASYDYSGFGNTHIILTADYAKNLGFDEKDILGRIDPTTFGIVNYVDLKDRTTAWQVRMDLGTPEIKKWSDWNLTFAYKYLERDAVLDAYTDSDFHLGGTNAKGWVVGGSYGLAQNTWLNARWMTADQIDGPDYGIDVLMVDLNARF
ncbi:putative porin [Methylococcus sp. EFPC2]|uniref:putative porin n=1 Tax=Methylococcus sp. EFPC2 TaxID=2812648 RepID=UPI001F082244|nr:putative porin [Methylococcus sp. EFPC2]